MATRKKCEAFAALHGLTLKVAGNRGVCYSVDLPDGKITESGMTGRGGDTDGDPMTMKEVWVAIMQDMEYLVEEKWLDVNESSRA